MDERTEDAALRRILPVVMGGQTYDLRTLTIEESDAWLAQVATAIAAIEMPDDLTWLGDIGTLLTASASAIAGLVAAYDIDGVLGGPDAIRASMSKRELKAAMDAMVTAEDPFGADVARSVARGFGVPSLALQVGMERALAESRLASLTNGRSAPTTSTTAPSAAAGATSSSSSAGPTTTTGRVAVKRSG